MTSEFSFGLNYPFNAHMNGLQRDMKLFVGNEVSISILNAIHIDIILSTVTSALLNNNELPSGAVQHIWRRTHAVPSAVSMF